MPRVTHIPGYRFHKQSGQAYVYLSGKQYLLGPFQSPQSKEKYGRLIAEWQAGQLAQASAKSATPLSVRRLLDLFWQHAERYYVKPDGTPAKELTAFSYPIRLLNYLYGSTPAADFGPKELKALREAMIRPLSWRGENGRQFEHRGWSRTLANHQTNRVKHIFKWAVSEELISASVYQALTAVDALRRGRTTARESPKVKPVPDAMVLQVLPHLPRPVRAMVELEALTGARGGELCQMRGCDMDMSNPEVWQFAPPQHKTAHHGKEKYIPLGKRCQEIIRPFLKTNPQAFLFCPAEWEAERRAEMTLARTTPPGIGNSPGTNRSTAPRRPAGQSYDPDAYGRAVRRACESAFPPPDELMRGRIKTGKKRSRFETNVEWRKRLGAEKWAELLLWQRAHSFSPHRLRHSAATRIAAEHGLEHASAVLGHSDLSTTLIYAEHQRQLADAVARKSG